MSLTEIEVSPLRPLACSQGVIIPSAANTVSLHLLIINATAEDLTAVRLALNAPGFTLTEVAKGENGLKAAHAQSPDCILLCGRLPKFDSLKIMHDLRKPNGQLPCAIILLTSPGDVDEATAVIKAGALDYLTNLQGNADGIQRAVRGAVERFGLLERGHASQERNAQLAAIVAASHDAIISIDIDLTVRTWNPGAVLLFGYAENEAVGRKMDELIVPEHLREDPTRVYEAALAGQRGVIKETLCQHKDGHYVSVEINASQMLDDGGTVSAASLVFRDLSERTAAFEGLARLASIVEFSDDAILSEGLDGTIQSWNSGAEKLFGYGAEDAIGKSITILGSPESIVEEDQIRAKLTLGGASQRIETTRLAKDGRRIDVWATISPLKNSADQVVGASTIIRDIGARKLAEAHVKMLLAEVNHRAKNLLGVVQAVARQTAKHSDPGVFAKRLSERIGSLAASQDLLVKSEWQGTAVSELITAQLAHFKDLIGTRISFYGPPVLLTSAAAQCIGMALHELATNAAKYGALSNEDGQVQISWQDNDGMFAMSWLEKGGPKVAVPSSKGFGQVVIGPMVERAVQGTVEISFP